MFLYKIQMTGKEDSLDINVCKCKILITKPNRVTTKSQNVAYNTLKNRAYYRKNGNDLYRPIINTFY